jgi:hypothetical protein
MAWDKDGNYIPTKQDKANEKAKKESKAFVKRMDKFLKTHKIIGTAYTYGFATTDKNLDSATAKLKKLKIKFKLDKTPNFHTKVVISKTEI